MACKKKQRKHFAGMNGNGIYLYDTTWEYKKLQNFRNRMLKIDSKTSL